MPGNLVVESITIEGLRGFNNAQTIELNGSHALISGLMGTGKSSTLFAIEWALFGDIAHIKCSESRTQAEFVNANKIDQMARVTLKLKGDDGEYIIHREKHAKKRDFNLTLTTPYGKFEGDDAANQIFSIFGTFEDFHRSVFLHQEAVRDLLTENPEQRDLALDRLFGLENTRELMKAIPITTVRKEYDGLENEKTKLEIKIKGATQQIAVEMERAKKDAFDIGLKEDDFDLSECIKRFKEIINDTLTAAYDCGIAKPSFLEPSTEEEVSKGLKKVKEVIKGCRMQVAATSKLDDLRRDSSKLKEAKENLENDVSKLKEATEEYERMEKNWGTIGQIEKQENGLKINEEKLRNERETIDSTAKLVADGIEVLSMQKLKNCPVCDAKISPKDVLSRLESKVSIALKESLSKIDGERKKIREELLQLVDHKMTISKAITNVKSAKKLKDDSEKVLGEILQSMSKGDKNLLKEVDKKLSELQEKINTEMEAFNKKNETLQNIEDSADICRAIVRVLEKEAAYEKIKETFAEEDSQIEILKTQINEMSSLYTRLQRISDAVATAQINLAREFINKGEKKISDYYGRLCGHPYYNSIRIDTDQRNVKGVQKNTYNIKAFNNKEGKETLINTRFSTGQMNCAALSIFLSLSSMLDRKMKFAILDDPSQSLDTEHKKSLLKVLEDASRESQIIIATQDAELEEELKDKFKPEGGLVAIEFQGWSKEGPRIKKSQIDY